MDTQKKTSKIIHHTRRVVHHVRSKPYEVRMQIVRIATVLVGLLVVVLWVSLLKYQLHIEPKDKEDNKENQQLIIEKVQRVYDKTKQPTGLTK